MLPDLSLYELGGEAKIVSTTPLVTEVTREERLPSEANLTLAALTP